MAREGIGTTENLSAAVIKRPKSFMVKLVIYGEDGESSVTKTLAQFDGSASIGEARELMAKIEEAAAAIAAGKKITIEEKNDG
jgi:hypothetical protein